MRQSNSTSKIVVGIALSVVFAIGVSIFAIRVRQMQQGQLAQSAGSSATTQSANQDAADAAAPAQQSPAPVPPEQPTGQAPGQSTAPAADAAPVAPGTNGAGDSATPRKPTLAKRANRPTGGARSGSGEDRTATRVASIAGSGAASADESATQTPERTAPDAATSADASGASGEQADPDSRISAAVKSQIDQAAPDNNVVVTTSNGVVALAGSLPSGDVVQLATQAASRVAGVRYVDSSALEVSKQ